MSPHLGWLLVLGVLAAGPWCSAPGVRSLVRSPGAELRGPTASCLLVFFDPTSSVFRLLLPLAPRRGRWAGGARVRALLLVAGVVGQLFWVSWVWDRTVQMTWIP